MTQNEMRASEILEEIEHVEKMEKTQFWSDKDREEIREFKARLYAQGEALLDA